MRLVVLHVASPFAPIDSAADGESEWTLRQLDSALVRAGHECIVIASEGSAVDGIQVSVPRQSMTADPAQRRRCYDQYRRVIGKLLERWSADVIHMHGADFYEYLPPPGIPVLATLHLPIDWYPGEIFHLDRPQTFLQCVSAAQHRECPPCSCLLPEIQNGIAPDEYSERPAKRDFAVALGRICPEKGFHIALNAAKRAEASLLLAGQLFRHEAQQNYFRREIAPQLDDERRFIGAIPSQRQRRLLSAARCLLAPSLTPETNALVAMESLACGTPVIALPSGALADVVEHGKTGFLVRDENEMADAIRAADSIDPEVCRKSVRERFSLNRMIREYFTVYESLACYPQALGSPA